MKKDDVSKKLGKLFAKKYDLDEVELFLTLKDDTKLIAIMYYCTDLDNTAVFFCKGALALDGELNPIVTGNFVIKEQESDGFHCVDRRTDKTIKIKSLQEPQIGLAL